MAVEVAVLRDNVIAGAGLSAICSKPGTMLTANSRTVVASASSGT